MSGSAGEARDAFQVRRDLAAIKAVGEELAEVRRHLAAAIGQIDAVSPKTRPIRIEPHKHGDLAVWHDDELIRIHTAKGYPETAFLSMPGWTAIETWPNWTAIGPVQLRTLAYNMLAVAAELDPEIPGVSG